MSIPLEEHDYIGLSEKSSCVSSMEINERKSKKHLNLNLKATELRLGLPGFESPERGPFGVLKGLVYGTKRGYSDTMNGTSRKLAFSKSEVDSAKGHSGLLFSPKGGSKILGAVVSAESNLQPSSMANVVKDPAPKSPSPAQEKKPLIPTSNGHGVAPATKTQVVGWPPIRSFRKKSIVSNPPKTEEDVDGKLGSACVYVKVSMDGAPYLRKVDLKIYKSYNDLSSALEKMFSCFTIGQCGTEGIPIRDGLTESRLMDLLHGSEYVLTYEDKDGDWMLVGDVPWEMFTGSCKRLKIMKSSDAIGLVEHWDCSHSLIICSKSHKCGGSLPNCYFMRKFDCTSVFCGLFCLFVCS
nr:auxin-responsive protein IAA27-like isoform X1 [Nicotiana tomentosiformis]